MTPRHQDDDFLAIPDFLKRKPGEVHVTAPAAPEPTQRRSSSKAVWVHLQDEIPLVGSGRRRVEVVTLGWKWVRVRVPGQRIAARVTRKAWDAVKKLGAEATTQKDRAPDLEQGETPMLDAISIAVGTPDFSRSVHAARAAKTHLVKAGVINPQQGIDFVIVPIAGGRYTWEPAMRTDTFTIKSNARRAARKAGLDPDAAVVQASGGKFRVQGLTNIGRQYAGAKAATAPEAPKPAKPKPPRPVDVAKALAKPRKAAKGAGKAAKATTAAPKPAKRAGKAEKPAEAGFRPGTLGAKVLALLERPAGATYEQIMEATGWQRHTVRGFMAGTIGGRLGLTVTREDKDGVKVYRVAAKAA